MMVSLSFERFLDEAEGLRPVELDGSAAFARLRAASSAERHAFFADFVRHTRARRSFASERGGFIVVALWRALAELLADDALDWRADDLDALLLLPEQFPEPPRMARTLALIARFGFRESALIAVLEGGRAEPSILALAYAEMPAGDAPWARRTRERIARLTPAARDAWHRFLGSLFADAPGYRQLDRWLAARNGDLHPSVGSLAQGVLPFVEPPASYAPVGSASGLTRIGELEGLLLEALAVIASARIADPSERASILGRLAHVAFTRVVGLGAWRPRLGYRCLDLLAEDGTEPAIDALRGLAAELRYPRAARYAAEAVTRHAGARH